MQTIKQPWKFQTQLLIQELTNTCILASLHDKANN